MSQAETPIEIGAEVVRINSPRDSIWKDGDRGKVTGCGVADNGEIYYFVQTSPGYPPAFWAGTRISVVQPDKGSG